MDMLQLLGKGDNRIREIEGMLSLSGLMQQNLLLYSQKWMHPFSLTSTDFRKRSLMSAVEGSGLVCLGHSSLAEQHPAPEVTLGG